MLMGTGNLTELTDADSSGVTAVLRGALLGTRIRNVLAVHVSPHTSGRSRSTTRPAASCSPRATDHSLPGAMIRGAAADP